MCNELSCFNICMNTLFAQIWRYIYEGKEKERKGKERKKKEKNDRINKTAK